VKEWNEFQALIFRSSAVVRAQAASMHHVRSLQRRVTTMVEAMESRHRGVDAFNSRTSRRATSDIY
jgi:hypothetical protein